jgi:hypothetical protein
MSYRLHQSIPMSPTERLHFMVAMFVSAILIWLLFVLIDAPSTMRDPHALSGDRHATIPDPSYVPPYLVGLLSLGMIFILNQTPVKRLHGTLQYAICCCVGLFLTRHSLVEDRSGLILIKGLFYGLALFSLFRVNWWFYWDNPSRRTPRERMFNSIFWTGLMPLFGLALGLYRLIGVGVEEPTTQFVADGKTGVVEQIPPDPALAEHKRRMDAVKAMGRTRAADKDIRSETV